MDTLKLAIVLFGHENYVVYDMFHRLLFRGCLCDGSKVPVGNDSCSSSRLVNDDGTLFAPPLQDDLAILLRKLGSSADPQMKRAGIIGDAVVTCLSILCS